MKALWCYEPFHQDMKRVQSMGQTLMQLIQKPNQIHVGFISTHQEPQLALAFDVPEAERFSEYPRSQIRKELKTAKVKISDSKIHVVEYPVFSTTKVIDRMIQLASDKGCDLIALFTHARTGYRRFVMGSFAETAVHRSPKDLLLLNPKVRVSPKIRKLLFASDFESSSKSEMARMLNYVKNIGAELTVFHHAEVTYRWSLDEKDSAILKYRQQVNDMKRWIENEARKKGVKVQIVIVADFKSTIQHVFRLVKKNNIHMIAVHAKASPLVALMGGSITRQIIRESPVPVLVLKARGKK